jgi:RND family efflux transporter MFP subunit
MYSSKTTILAAFAAVALTGCGREAPHGAATQATPAAAPVAVTVAEASVKDWPAIHEAVGTVRARASSIISARVMGYIREVRVHVGDTVREGQTLITLDSREVDVQTRQAEAAVAEARQGIPEIENAIAAAAANLALAESTHGRMKDLFDKKSISNQEYDEVSAKLRMARANRDMARSRREQLNAKIRQAQEAVEAAKVMQTFSEIKAPFSGVVTEKRADPGTLATPGAPLLLIEQSAGFRLEASLEESKIALARIGQSVEVTLDAVSKPLSGRVSEIVPAADAASRAFTVKIDLPGLREVRSGMFGRVRFLTAGRQALAIPSTAVREQGQMQSAFVVDGGVARSRLVTLGGRHGDAVEALSGLRAGEKVVAPLPATLFDGASVEVRQ